MRVALLTLLATLLLGSTASAGGWAVTTLDQLPPSFQAGQTYDIGYTIRQHGVTPINLSTAGSPFGGTTEIIVTTADGKSLTFPGVQTGATGHYVAKVTFPAAGQLQWQVTQGGFAPQSLGVVTVLAGSASAAQPAAAASATAPQPAGPNALLVVSLLLAISGAAVLFGTRVAALTARASA